MKSERLQVIPPGPVIRALFETEGYSDIIRIIPSAKTASPLEQVMQAPIYYINKGFVAKRSEM
jgi:hypothetical protein